MKLPRIARTPRPRVPPSERPRVKPRRMEHAFDDVPRLWFRESTLGTAMVNSLCLLFPWGEKMFIRSVRRYADRVATVDAEDGGRLREEVRGFIAQEMRHAAEHERLFATFEAQGYRIRPFLAFYERFGDGLEARLPETVRLAVTVALEHYTAMFAARALSPRPLLDEAPEVMRALLQWHAAEEIEHKCVAFDVLARVDPRYATRMAGLAVGTLGLLGFWIAGTAMFLAQEPAATPTRVAREVVAAVRAKMLLQGDVPRALVEYLRPDFHPAQLDDFQLARDYFARARPSAA